MDKYDYITLTERGACNMLPRRSELSHKGSFGTLLIVAGSTFYTGAAALCTMSALKSGVGIACLASVKEAYAVVGTACPEATFLPFEADSEGGIPNTALSAVKERAKSCSALLIGCGIGRFKGVSALARDILEKNTLPAVVDADGLNAVCGETGLLKGCVITPHMGEMARLCSTDIAAVKAEPEQAALKFAAENGCTVVLKDADTLVASPDGRLFLNTGRNSGMAKGGSGDVLAGITASLLAQGMQPFDAACAGVTLHSAAGKRCAQKYSRRGMLPHELPDMLREIFSENGL